MRLPEFQNHPIMQLQVFKTQEFKEFEAQLTEAMSLHPTGPVLHTTISQAAPELTRIFSVHTDAVATNHNTVVSLLQKLAQQVTTLERTVERQGQRIESLLERQSGVTPDDLPRSEGAVDPLEHPSADEDEVEPDIPPHAELFKSKYKWPEENNGVVMQYALSSGVVDVAGVVQEFRRGWEVAQGGPSVNELDSKLGSRWRSGSNSAAKKYSRRRRVVHRVWQLEQRNIGEVEAVRIAQLEMGKRKLESYGDSLESCQDKKMCGCRAWVSRV